MGRKRLVASGKAGRGSQTMSGGFRPGEDNPVALAAAFTTRSTTFLREAYQREFGLSEPEVLEIINLVRQVHAHLDEYGKLFRWFGDTEGREDRTVEEMRTCMTRLIAASGAFRSSVLSKAVAAMPRLMERETEIEHEIEAVAADIARVSAFVLMNPLQGPTRPGYLYTQGTQTGSTLRRLLEPKMEKPLRAYYLSAAISMVSTMAVYQLDEVMEEMQRFSRTFFRITDGFVDRARQTQNTLEWRRLGCFKAMAYAIVVQNSKIQAYTHFLQSTFGKNVLATEALDCPYLLTLEDGALERLERIARSVPTERITRLIIGNPQWVDPARLEELEQLIVELTRENSGWMPVLKGRPLATALKTARRMNERKDLRELYAQVATAKTPIRAIEFAEYALEVADQPLSNEDTRTFHEVLQSLLPSISNDMTAQIVRSAGSLYVSDYWGKVAEMLQGKPDVQRMAAACLKAIEGGDFETAGTMIEQHQATVKGEARRDVTARVTDGHPGIEGSDRELLVRTYERLERTGVGPKRFSALRKHGRETVVALARQMQELSDPAFRIALGSDVVRPLFVKAVKTGGYEGLAENMNGIAEAAAEGAEGIEETLGFELERHLDEARAIEQGRFRRIVLVAGEQIAAGMAARLSKRTRLEVKVIAEDRPKEYFQSVLRPGDAVIIAISHLAHNPSGKAVAICRSRGIEFFQGSETNAERIVERLQAAA